MPAEGDAPADPDTTYRPGRDGVLLTVRVPAAASIRVNGLETSSTGDVRRYVSRGLESGYAYNYEVEATIVLDGQEVVEKKSVRVRAGQSVALDFDMTGEDVELNAQQTEERPATKLTLIVPAEAKVFLAGRETKSTGEVREFVTTKLTGGEWADYPVRVEMEVDGETLVQERTVSLAAGDNEELTFEFEAAKVAQLSATR